MATKLLTKRLAFLWLCICGGRLLYIFASYAKQAYQPILALAILTFLLAMIAEEVAILKGVAEVSRRESSETEGTPPTVYPLGTKIVIGIFMYSLVFVIWTTRSDNEMVLPIIVGTAMNLWWVWIFASQKLRRIPRPT